VSRSTPSISAENDLNALDNAGISGEVVQLRKRPLTFQGFELFFELALGLLGALDDCGEIFFVHAKACGDFVQQLPGALVIRERGNTRDGFDAAHPGGGGLLEGNLNTPISPVRRTCVPPQSSLL